MLGRAGQNFDGRGEFFLMLFSKTSSVCPIPPTRAVEWLTKLSYVKLVEGRQNFIAFVNFSDGGFHLPALAVICR